MTEKKKGFSPRTRTPSEYTRHLQNRILEMKRDGTGFAEIARELGVSDTYVKKMYKHALNLIVVDNVEQTRKMELLRLERAEREIVRVLQTFHPMVSGGSVVRDVVDGPDGEVEKDEHDNPKLVRLEDVGPRLAAVDRYLKIMERRAKLLGLDMPNKVALTDPSGEKITPVQFYLPSNGRDDVKLGQE